MPHRRTALPPLGPSSASSPLFSPKDTAIGFRARAATGRLATHVAPLNLRGPLLLVRPDSRAQGFCVYRDGPSRPTASARRPQRQLVAAAGSKAGVGLGPAFQPSESLRFKGPSCCGGCRGPAGRAPLCGKVPPPGVLVLGCPGSPRLQGSEGSGAQAQSAPPITSPCVERDPAPGTPRAPTDRPRVASVACTPGVPPHGPAPEARTGPRVTPTRRCEGPVDASPSRVFSARPPASDEALSTLRPLCRIACVSRPPT